MTSITNGWDAICAIELSEVNRVLMQEYLAPFKRDTALQFACVAWSSGLEAFATAFVSAPGLSFAENGGQQSASLSVTVRSAEVVPINGGIVMWLSGSDVPVLRTVDLQSVDGGTDALGQVVVTFGGSNVPASGSTLMDAIASGVMAAPATYTLGTILDGNSGPGLQPSSFGFGIQNSSDGSRTALLLLITTSGQAGSALPLPQYPLPAGSTAALIVGAQNMFTSVFPGVLTTEFFNTPLLPPATPVQLSGQQDGEGSWQSVVTSGAANFGDLLAIIPNGPSMFTVNAAAPGTPASCQIPLTGPGAGFTVSCAGGALRIDWSTIWSQGWTCTLPNIGTFYSQNMKFTYACVSTPRMDPVTGIVTFDGQQTSSLGFDPASSPPGILLPLFEPPAQLWQLPQSGGMQKLFDASFFQIATLASLNTFALANLLFPQQNALSLTSLAFTGDMQLTGSLVPMITVTPALATVAPGGVQQFTASEENVFWECQGIGGTIDSSTGRYTAPSEFTPDLHTVSARGQHGTTFAQILPLVQPSAVTVSPASAFMAWNQTLVITLNDANGAPVDCICVLGEGDPGTLSQISTGTWNYLSPPQFDAGTTVTVTATSSSDPTHAGRTTIDLVFPDVLTLTWGDGSSQEEPKALALGTTINLTAAAQSGYTNFVWGVFAGVCGGSIVPVANDSTTATLTVPTVAGNYAVGVYYADKGGRAFGITYASFTVS